MVNIFPDFDAIFKIFRTTAAQVELNAGIKKKERDIENWQREEKRTIEIKEIGES